MLTYVVHYISACIIQLTFIYSFKLLTKNKEHKKRYFFLIFIFSGIMTILYYYNQSFLNTILSMLFYFILFQCIYKKSIKETAFFGSSIWIIAILIDLFTMFRSPLLTNLFNHFNVNLLYERALDTIITSIILILILKSRKIQIWINALYKRSKKSNFPGLQLLLLIIVLLSIGYTFYYVTIGESTQTIQNYIYLLVGSVTVLILIYVNKEFNNYALKETNDYLVKDNEFYITLLDDYRMFKHNIFHQINGLKSVANKKTIKLIDDIINLHCESNIGSSNIKKMPLGINRIVYEKIYYFNNKDIRLGIDNNIKSDLYNNLTSRSYNLLCEALGVLMDNALQATSKTKEKILMIDMREDELSYQIKIINTFQDLLDLEKLGTIKYSTKSSGHGLGLFSLIGRRKLKIKTSIINDLFLNEITIEKHFN